MKNLKSLFPKADAFVRNSTDGVLSDGPVSKELVICLKGLGNSHDAVDTIVIQLSNNGAMKIALQLLENLSFEGKWL